MSLRKLSLLRIGANKLEVKYKGESGKSLDVTAVFRYILAIKQCESLE